MEESDWFAQPRLPCRGSLFPKDILEGCFPVAHDIKTPLATYVRHRDPDSCIHTPPAPRAAPSGVYF